MRHLCIALCESHGCSTRNCRGFSPYLSLPLQSLANTFPVAQLQLFRGLIQFLCSIYIAIHNSQFPPCDGSDSEFNVWFIHFINVYVGIHIYVQIYVYVYIYCNFGTVLGLGFGCVHEEFHYNLHNLCTTVICIIKICTFEHLSIAFAQSPLALVPHCLPIVNGPHKDIFLCKHIITNSKSQNPNLRTFATQKMSISRTV